MEFLTNIFALFISFVAIAMGCLVLFSPFILLAWLTKSRVSTQRSKRSTKDQMVDAQWEYDRTLRRKD